MIVLNKDNKMNNKVCTACGIAKDITNFYNKDSRCKKCKIMYQKEKWYNKKEQLINLKELNDEKSVTIRNLQVLCNFYEEKVINLENEIKKLNVEIKKLRRKKHILDK